MTQVQELYQISHFPNCFVLSRKQSVIELIVLVIPRRAYLVLFCLEYGMISSSTLGNCILALWHITAKLLLSSEQNCEATEPQTYS